MPMKRSECLVEESAIVTCHIGEGFLIVTFSDGYGYLFNSIKPGPPIVNEMIELAKMDALTGLGEYIKWNASENYYRKLE
jgi:hypothetical protein